MVRLRDVSEVMRNHLTAKSCPPFPTQPWVTGPPLAERRVALITTAGLHRHDDQPFFSRTGAYRIIPGDITGRDLFMSHASVNFDRTGFQQDLNICFPIQRLHELAEEGVIGSVAAFHYTVSGAPHPSDLADSARDISRMMKADGVDTVLLVPI